MKSVNTNILIIGVGPFARAIYVPYLTRFGIKYNAQIKCCIDLLSEKETIDSYINEEYQDQEIALMYITQNDAQNPEYISNSLRQSLNDLCEKHNINTVIISTPPLYHYRYIVWALDKELHILVDKPPFIEAGVVNNIDSCRKMIDNFFVLKNMYLNVKKKRKGLVFSVLAQRRFHPFFDLIKDKILEAVNKTYCPVTSITALYNDGQWRLPNELAEIRYHGFADGFGKFAHSGYHFIDLVSQLVDLSSIEKKKPNNIEVVANATFPNDFMEQVSYDDYKKIFGNSFDARRTQVENKKLTDSYGELDAYANIQFLKNERVITNANISLLHSGFSQRGWANPNVENLYKGNGRLRHESYYISQGPFQSIVVESYQSTGKSYRPGILHGEEDHFDIHVFRNQNVISDWQNYELIKGKDIIPNLEAGHMEEAKHKALAAFLNNISGTNPSLSIKSDFVDHENSVKILAAIYQSISHKKNRLSPLIKMDLAYPRSED